MAKNKSICEVEPFEVEVYSNKLKLRSNFIGRATVVGAYFMPYWHPFTYSAYHVVFKDGRKDTVFAIRCKEVKR